MVRELVVLERLEQMIYSSVDELKKSNIVLKDLYVRFAQVIYRRLVEDMQVIRRTFRKAGIRLGNSEEDGDVVYHQYTCRGNEDRLGVDREALRSDIAARLTLYTSAIVGGKQQEQQV